MNGSAETAGINLTVLTYPVCMALKLQWRPKKRKETRNKKCKGIMDHHHDQNQ